MSTHIEALKQLSARGDPRGVEVLIRDIGGSLADSPTARVQPLRSRRRPSGPVLGAVVAAIVIGAGLVGGWVAGRSDEVSSSGILWKQVEAAEGLADVASGPGGLLSVSFSAARGVWFSPDGVSWTQSQLPESDSAFVESVLATHDRWLVNGSDGESRLAWWSEDGRTWIQVDWPTEIAQTIQEITATPEHFFVVSRDVFGEGTTLWRSEDAETWAEIPTGPVTGTSGFLEGTDGGLVLRDEADVSISADGTTWSTATLAPPSDLGADTAWIESVDHIGDRWIAVVAVERIDQDPVLAVMSSVDGELWNSEGIPPFSRADDLAPGLQTAVTIGDRLVVVRARQVWSTTDGVNWVPELSTDQHIIDVAGAIIDGQPVGIWIGLGNQDSDTQTSVQEPEVVTTVADMPNEPVDPEGLEFQAAVTEDGIVTLEEFEQTLENWKTCMEEHGVTDVEVSVDRAGGWSSSYASPSPDGAVENALANLCEASWVTRVASQLGGQ
jgi:hypothetical protein